MILETTQDIILDVLEDTIPHHLIDPLINRLDEIDIKINFITNSSEVSNSLVIMENCSTVSEIIEQIIQQIPFEFEELPLLIEGESKVIRLLNEKIVIEKFKPTVYSYTHNRYGIAEKTDDIRVKFTSEIFRRMQSTLHTSAPLKNAFLACIETPSGNLLVQKRMNTCNLEVRVKRFHIGSPVHRYRYTEQYRSLQKDQQPIAKYTRFDEPIVCFDWRNPLNDESGKRLADEPISDDYAAVWMHNITNAKKLASDTFKWLEQLFMKKDFTLIDICFFINEEGDCLYGEISPDCMRVRKGSKNSNASYDKDIWRNGGAAQEVSDKYQELFQILSIN